jgi:hypothetical protein
MAPFPCCLFQGRRPSSYPLRRAPLFPCSMAAQQRRSSPPRLQLPRRPLLILPRAAATGRPSSPARRSTPCCPLCPAFFPHGKQQDQCRPGPCSSPLPHKTAAAASPPSSMASSLPPDAQELFSLLGTAPLIHSPGSAAALPFVLHSPRRVSSLSCSLRSPIRDAVETRGENPPPPPLSSMFIFRCV